jgi:predicted small metal-binding protein
MSEILRARCACGWETTGPEAEVVAATIEHGRRLHNMMATPEQVIAAAVRVDDAESPDGAGLDPEADLPAASPRR